MTCVATSTGGITNKLPGRIGDTPTLGAGFWAEEWDLRTTTTQPRSHTSPLTSLTTALSSCLPTLTPYLPLRTSDPEPEETPDSRKPIPSIPSKRSIAISGTGNGDSFLRLSAARTAAAIAQYQTPNSREPHREAFLSKRP
ncbi:hypothetical protein BTJ68_07674 [Hortaea werneckii EXF-2000]|uniref:Uncharacterized protein n=1 Tax=Hortaea werneckii EXF-2000 TaxID=1157616 RepID=A0A1Z5T6C7_HORWE|nr:hypothetical protein BTJ68_07674 [Hortaea werneckii EXF-2000]